MTRVLHRSLIDRPPVAKGANGVEIIDSEGRRYIDACGGAAVSSLGHAHPDVLAAMHAQIDSIPYAHSGFFTTEAAEELAADLIDHAPNGLSRVYLTSGGSEAVEAALKLARQYFVESGQPERRRCHTVSSRSQAEQVYPCADRRPAPGISASCPRAHAKANNSSHQCMDVRITTVFLTPFEETYTLS